MLPTFPFYLENGSLDLADAHRVLDRRIERALAATRKGDVSARAWVDSARAYLNIVRILTDHKAPGESWDHPNTFRRVQDPILHTRLLTEFLVYADHQTRMRSSLPIFACHGFVEGGDDLNTYMDLAEDIDNGFFTEHRWMHERERTALRLSAMACAKMLLQDFQSAFSAASLAFKMWSTVTRRGYRWVPYAKLRMAHIFIDAACNLHKVTIDLPLIAQRLANACKLVVKTVDSYLAADDLYLRMQMLAAYDRFLKGLKSHLQAGEWEWLETKVFAQYYLKDIPQDAFESGNTIVYVLEWLGT